MREKTLKIAKTYDFRKKIVAAKYHKLFGRGFQTLLSFWSLTATIIQKDDANLKHKDEAFVVPSFFRRDFDFRRDSCFGLSLFDDQRRRFEEQKTSRLRPSRFIRADQ